MVSPGLQNPLVYVLVINWNGIEHLAECFRSLLAGDYPQCRFLLIDNASTDGSVEFVRNTYGGDPRVEILSLADNLGWSRGNNAGIEQAIEAGADYVFLLNNDTSTAPDAVSKLVEMAEGHREIGALAPKMLLYDNPTILNSVGLECSVIASSWDLGIGRLDGAQWDTPRTVIGACGGAAFFRVDALRKTGLLPADFEIYLDDLDLGMRIWDAGYEVRTCPAARVRHKFSATMGQGQRAQRKYYLNTRNRLYVILRNFPASRMPFVFAACVLGECRALGRAVLDREWWRIPAHVKAWAAGVAYVPRAMRERLRRRRAGIPRGLFWQLIRTDCMFFWGVEFPEAGWYRACEVRGARVRPMSVRAQSLVQAGPLRVTHANCYPALGKTCVEVLAGGHVAARLETLDREEIVLRVPAGVIELVSRRVFLAEETGAAVDYGGWIALESVG